MAESNAGGSEPLFGAKITGGGCGGTVCVLGRNTADGEAAVADVIAKYAAATGHTPVVFSGSSMGAGAFGVLEVAFPRAVVLGTPTAGAD